MKTQKYILKTYFKTSNSVDYDIIPIFETSKEEIKRKLDINCTLYDQFELYKYDWNTSDIQDLGYEIFTISEFWGETE